MPYITVGQKRGSKVDINYELYGQGPTKILFVMGLASALDSWKFQVEGFVQERDEEGNATKYDPRYQICVFDNRGVGLSGSPFGFYTTDMMALDALEITHQLGWKQFHLVGLSMGGMISQRMALFMLSKKENPLHFQIPTLLSLSLIVTHCGGKYSDQPEKGKWMGRRVMMSWTEETRNRRILPMLFSEAFLADTEKTEAAYEWIKNSRAAPGGKPTLTGLFGQLSAVTTHRTTDEELIVMRDSGVPIMIMTGDEDYLVDPQNSEEMNTVLRPVQYIVMKATGHGINAEKSKEFNEAMFAHVERGEERRKKMEMRSSGEKAKIHYGHTCLMTHDPMPNSSGIHGIVAFATFSKTYTE
ncbi:hypothetical protein PROFUN_05896 [Planoprotostelium fungivorum]|uniref:AB hydrolase-1 domain-containing protein n=1 Tax=Planoprotostelium fungivorum TaxID=1890364 RepID=A0A2P6NKR7_9EUKA|nr:hypothetical protein PROFUN_05896 [Planoprotostelium fungivorum]